MKNKYAGVTLDWYDDKGATLKTKFPAASALPDIIKEADVRPMEKLANEDFALVAIDSGHVMRKFACHDPGTTAMSVIYFMEHGDKLPEGAQKMAAANLVDACKQFELKPPAVMEKMAGKAAPKEKVADITGKRPAPKMKVASSNDPGDYAVVLPDGRRFYPIHTWDLVKKAEDYFQDKRNRMQPEIRRQYAVKLAAKAYTIGYPVDPEILDAGATEWAPSGHLKAAVEMRKIACQPGNDRRFLDELFEKRASLEPGTYAEVLRRFDVKHGLDRGWDHVILDPWASTFGMNKQADVVWEDGNDRVTNDQLVSLAQNHLPRLRQILTESMCKEFLKDPAGIFESMPLPQKKIISRLASDHPENSEITQAVV